MAKDPKTQAAIAPHQPSPIDAKTPATELISQFELDQLLRELEADMAAKKMIQHAANIVAERDQQPTEVEIQELSCQAMRLRDIRGVIAEIYQNPANKPVIKQEQVNLLLEQMAEKLRRSTERGENNLAQLVNRATRLLAAGIEAGEKAALARLPQDMQQKPMQALGEKLGLGARGIAGFAGKAARFSLDLSLIALASPWLLLRGICRAPSGKYRQSRWCVDGDTGRIYLKSKVGQYRSYYYGWQDFQTTASAIGLGRDTGDSALLKRLDNSRVNIPNWATMLVAAIALVPSVLFGVRAGVQQHQQRLWNSPNYVSQQVSELQNKQFDLINTARPVSIEADILQQHYDAMQLQANEANGGKFFDSEKLSSIELYDRKNDLEAEADRVRSGNRLGSDRSLEEIKTDQSKLATLEVLDERMDDARDDIKSLKERAAELAKEQQRAATELSRYQQRQSELQGRAPAPKP